MERFSLLISEPPTETSVSQCREHHMAESHDDTSAGAIHHYQDEHGTHVWHSSSFNKAIHYFYSVSCFMQATFVNICFKVQDQLWITFLILTNLDKRKTTGMCRGCNHLVIKSTLPFHALQKFILFIFQYP